DRPHPGERPPGLLRHAGLPGRVLRPPGAVGGAGRSPRSPEALTEHPMSRTTVVKAELQVSDMDRHYYATHNLTLAQHPSETDERLMVRLLAFASDADDRLEYGRGLSDEDEPALWRRDYTGDTELWIDA